MDRFDPFVKYADVYGDVINWEKDPMNKPQNQNKYFFSDGKTYYEQICKMLRLMSVFKQAFNQIYDNEDEIHTAWENFVDNLSATAVYGEEVGVNLTWTDTSVNFAFTIPGGQDGEDGVGIQSITFNSDYTMTITLTDGSTYTSESLRGAQGEQGIQGLQGPAGPQGEPGSGLEILDVYATLQDLQTAHPTGSPGDAYQVGTAPSFTLYIWSASQSAWVSAGTIGSAVPSSADPLMDGTASAGISDLYARGDHVHPTDTSRASAQDLQTVDDKVDAVDDRVDDINDVINTSQKLIDQSFVYRESPAEHDGLAVLDKIKGHTVKFNQLIQNGNFADDSVWGSAQGTFSVSGNKLIATAIGTPLQIFQGSTNGYKSGEKFYIACGIKASVSTNVRLRISRNSPVGLHNYGEFSVSANVHTRLKSIITLLNDLENTRFSFFVTDSASGDTFELDNFICINLTAIFGAGSEPTTPEAFETWLSQNLGLLPYYDYTLGSLISFNGTGLKTTGKNLFNYDDLEVGGIDNDTGLNLGNANHRRLVNYIYTGTFKTFSISGVVTGEWLRIFEYDGNKNFIESTLFNNQTITVSSNCAYIRISGSATGYTTQLQIEIGNVSSSFEPYTSNTLSLPISTYFPTGMKLAGSVYDEISDKAYTRVGSIDLGTLDWSYNTTYSFFWTQGLTYLQANENYLCSNYLFIGVKNDASMGEAPDKTIGIGTGLNIKIKDSSYTDPTAFKTAMSGVMLYYELATPTEQDIDLDLSFKAYQDGTEQLLPVNGSTPTTSSLLADMTYFSINDAMDYILAKLDQVPSSITSDINSLKTRMTSAEGNITSLGGRMTLAEDAILDLDQDISDIDLMLTRLRGKTVFEYLTDADQGYTTSQLDMTDLQNATHIEIIYTKTGTSNVMTTGLIPWKIFDATSVQFGYELAQAGLNEYKTRLLGISATGMLIINGCQVQTPDASPVIMNSLFIVRQVNLYRITKSNDIS